MRFDQSKAIVSVVIPCLNEEEAISAVVGDLLDQGADEVLVVDGGSTDHTCDRARVAGAKVVKEERRGYGRACAAGVSASRPDTAVIVFTDGDGSDVPSFLTAVCGPVVMGEADFVIGSRLRGHREKGSMTLQQIVAGHVAGTLLRFVYGVRFTDMAPFRAIRRDALIALGMREETYGWNLEMQMRAAAKRLRILEVPVDHRRRTGGKSKVSGNLVGGLFAAWSIARTFMRLALALRRSAAS